MTKNTHYFSAHRNEVSALSLAVFPAPLVRNPEMSKIILSLLAPGRRALLVKRMDMENLNKQERKDNYESERWHTPHEK